MTSVSCRIAAPWVTALGSGDSVRFGFADRHIHACLHCQAQLVRVRRMQRSLEQLGDRRVELPNRQVGYGAYRWEETSAAGESRLIAPYIGAVVVLVAGVLGIRRAISH